MLFDKKTACLTNYQERRNFPWPLVAYNPALPNILLLGGSLELVDLTHPHFIHADIKQNMRLLYAQTSVLNARISGRFMPMRKAFVI